MADEFPNINEQKIIGLGKKKKKQLRKRGKVTTEQYHSPASFCTEICWYKKSEF